jgi:cell division protein FtsB
MKFLDGRPTAWFDEAMPLRPRVPRMLRAVVPPLLALGLTGYFVFHAFHGDHGVLARMRLERQVESLTKELELVRGEREAIEKRVSLLRPQSLDPDMLEERARRTLGYAHPNEVIILREAPQAAPAPQK